MFEGVSSGEGTGHHACRVALTAPGCIMRPSVCVLAMYMSATGNRPGDCKLSRGGAERSAEVPRWQHSHRIKTHHQHAVGWSLCHVTVCAWYSVREGGCTVGPAVHSSEKRVV
jgi:hypothetical protein